MPVCSFREVPLNLLHTPNQQRLLVKASFVLFIFVFYPAAQDGFNMALISRCIWASSADVRFSIPDRRQGWVGRRRPNARIVSIIIRMDSYNCIRITRVLRVGSRLYLVCISSCIHVVG
jgi:hypothetical protein